MIQSKIIADSINFSGDRITSFELVMPRIILAEFNTHRMFSRNSASSRAIPFEKMIEMVNKTPFLPQRWMKNHKGMQGSDFFEERNDLDVIWLEARDFMIKKALELADKNATKQMINRLLEPFMYHKVICTATDYENFFALRAEDAAEIHMQELAYKMLEEYNNNEPVLLEKGKWHRPYGNNIDKEKLLQLFPIASSNEETKRIHLENLYNKIAVARCAGVSYTIVGDDGVEENYEKLILRYDKLSQFGHWSPFEHIARCVPITREGNSKTEYFGNFRGWLQLRKTFKNENKTDSRCLSKKK